MFVYMAREKAPRIDGVWQRGADARLHKRGEVGPDDDAVGFRKRMEDQGYEVRMSSENLGDEIDPAGGTIHKRVVRRPGRAVEVLEGGAS